MFSQWTIWQWIRVSGTSAAVGFVMAGAVSHAQVLGTDNFDATGQYINRSITPDNSANNGRFPSSTADVFGITDRTVNGSFRDDSLTNPADSLGILRSTKTDKVFGGADIDNPDNPSAVGTAFWDFNVTGATSIRVSIDFAAMADFEAANDGFNFTTSLDGGASQPLFTSVIREDLSLNYTMEFGNVVPLVDPLEINGTLINNVFQTLSAPVVGTGNVLRLLFTGTANGDNEVFAFDNIVVENVSGNSEHSWASGSATGLWSTPANWQPSGVPAADWAARVRNTSAPALRKAIVAANSSVNSVEIAGVAGAMELQLDAGITLTVAQGVSVQAGGILSGAGTLLGNVTNGGLVSVGVPAGGEALAAAVPEPSALVLFAIGLSVGALRRRGCGARAS